MSDLNQQLADISTKTAALKNNQVSRVAFTENAYNDDIADGVENYDYESEQNIPLASKTELNPTVVSKGFRGNSASLPRPFLNHFFGRVSYNLNKIVDFFKVVVDAVKTLNKLAGRYSPTEEYIINDVCSQLVTVGTRTQVMYFIRKTSTPEKLVGVPPITDGVQSAHWENALKYVSDSPVFSSAPYVGDNVMWHAGNDGAFVKGDSAYKTVTVTNYNNITASGFYSNTAFATGAPETGNFCVVHTQYGAGAQYATQTAKKMTEATSTLWHRAKNNGTWGAWSKCWDNNNDGSASGLDADFVRNLGLAHAAEGATSASTLASVIKGITDANAITGNGVIFSSNVDTINFPTTSEYYSGIQFYIAYNPQYKVQIVCRGATNMWYVRTSSAGTWGAWAVLWHAANDGSGSGLDADLLDGQHGSYYAPNANPTFTGTVTAPRAQIANTFVDTGVFLTTQDGFLITTDIPPTVDRMIHLEFTMNTFNSGYPCIGNVQCYAYATGSLIYQNKYSAIGDAPAYCIIFFSASKLCFWIPKTGDYQTLHPVLHTNVGSYKIISTTAEALPATRDRAVQANVLLPWSSINDGHGSGLDADTVDGVDFANGRAGTYATKSLSAGETWVIPAGLYIMSQQLASVAGAGEGIIFQLYTGGAWQGTILASGLILSDGVNYRLYNVLNYAGSIYYRKLS